MRHKTIALVAVFSVVLGFALAPIAVAQAGIGTNAAVYAAAQVDDDQPLVKEAAVEAAVDKVVDKIEVPPVPEEPTADDVVTAVIKNVNDWRHGAWLAATLGLVYILLLVSRLKPIADVLARRKLKFIKPAIAAAFGGLSGAVAAVSVGQPPLGAIIAGVIAGLSSSGFHELIIMSKRRKEEHDAAERESVTPKPDDGGES